MVVDRWPEPRGPLTDVVVRLRSDVARAWRGGTEVPSATQLQEVLSRFQTVLQPQHPGSADPQLESFFTAAAETPDQAGRLAAALIELDAVDAAYVQPPPTPA